MEKMDVRLDVGSKGQDVFKDRPQVSPLDKRVNKNTIDCCKHID